ncbi:MAG TPA: LacI family transcriptional regulator [Candidatus Atribacteria bacterium]|nr:LacI family transcriptional regulator [Candidatus Atribacteria bacterium]
MSVTIKDVAERLGVSAVAVSKALNDRKDISEKLKRKVRETARKLNYTPNSIAKRLVTNKSNTIGVFIFSRQEHTFSKDLGLQFLGGILEEANKNNYDIVIFSIDSDLLNKKSYIELCKERKAEGAIFTGLRLDDPHIGKIKNSTFPISIIDTFIEGKNVNFVSTDNKLGVRLALDYLWGLGHRRIAMINGHRNAQVSRKRLNAYRDYLKEREVYDERLVFRGDFTEDSGYQCAKKIMRLKELPTAIFVASDLMALGVIKAFKESSFKLPEDMSIIGFDNISIGEYIEPSLTTIGQDAVGMGKWSVRLILNEIKGIRLQKKCLLKPKLIIRDSCSIVNDGKLHKQLKERLE